ncbi:hypothetical protein [Streptomyces bobili]|uniref:hypothetical protein n=1 Tax=Streptomyces bobili TaxID=67280 RepID=UPI003787969C
MSADTLAVQVRAEDHRWQRDQRQAAYQAMLEADLRLTGVIGTFTTSGGSVVTDESRGLITTARGEVYGAVTLIEITGPQQVRTAAGLLLDSVSTLIAFQPVQRAQVNQWARALRRHEELRTRFRQAAREALGYVDLDDSTADDPGIE